VEIRAKKVLVLGGWGLVGMAICRRILADKPYTLIVHSLTRQEAEEAVENLHKMPHSDTAITAAWGNIFVRAKMAGLGREEILQNMEYRNWLIDDTLEALTEDLLKSFHLYKMIDRHRPDIVIDCINSATALAYQDVFRGYYNLKGALKTFKEQESQADDFVAEVGKILCTLYIPQLIRHVQVLYESMRRSKTGFYVKIGTSGTGGMGLNIPYTHSEEKPSRNLLSKSAVAGAHSMLLFLMARTPDAPITKEIKPTAAIAWKKIAYGEIRKGRQPIQLYDCTPDKAVELKDVLDVNAQPNWVKRDDETLKSVYVDTGENGIFSYGEFSAISSSGQMELVTPEEIAKNVVYEIRGGNTGHDVINALDNATMGPTYRAGLLREVALQQMQELMKENDCESIAFELLGPPRLSKLLYEAFLLRKTCGTLKALAEANPGEIADRMEKLISENEHIRSAILSIGIPILLPDGKRLLRGPEMKIPPYRGETQFNITDKAIDEWARNGWIDVRESNMKTWQKRVAGIFEEMKIIPDDDTSSQFDRNRNYWAENDYEINIGKVVGWIFSNEEQGLRMKD
jgi:hypothetical protein